MTSTYRGQSYTSSNITAAQSPSTFTYRGHSYQKSQAVTTTSPEKLVYRGVSYTSSELNNPSLRLNWELA
jgi:hypothetical protein